MIKKYSYFKEDVSKAKSIMSKKIEAFDKLKILLDKNIGYFGKFTEYLMYENISYEDLVELYKKLINLKSKNVNIDINELRYEKVCDTIIIKENELLVNSLTKQFPSKQKELVKELSKNTSLFNALLKVAKKGNYEALISKISRYKTLSELNNALSIFAKDSNNDRENIKKTLKDLNNSSISFENDNILIVKVGTLGDINILGSDSSWCILNQSNWSSYTKDNRKQFILFDYRKDSLDPKFKIGFTLSNNGGVYACHDLLDKATTIDHILLENGIKTLDLIDTVTSDKSKDISSIKSISGLKEYIKDNSLDIVKDSTKVILDKLYGIRNPVSYLSDAKQQVAEYLCDKLFGGFNVLTLEILSKYDSRLTKFVKDSSYIGRKLINPNIMNIRNASDEFIETGLNMWSDQVIVDYSSNILSLFRSKVSFDKMIKVSKETLLKISNRLNKIYSDDTFDKTKESVQFFISIVFLNYYLNRKDIFPELFKYITDNHKHNYIGLFSDEFELKEGKFYLDMDFPIESIVKKDYPNTIIDISFYSFKIVNTLLNHLDGYEIVLGIDKKDITHLTKLTRKEDSEKMLQLREIIDKFPQNPRKGSSVSANKIKVIIV